ncbi:MAG: Holliday junction branch migration protein RuvA [Myxococcota bacterium]
MIGRLTGKVADRGMDGTVILDVAGVGYELFVPVLAMSRLTEGDDATLHVHTHAREDVLALYGFETVDDRRAFRALLGVSNIGPKSALAILGALDAPQLADAIAREDRAALKGIPGVGKKTIERIFLDLKDKLLVYGKAGTPRPNVTKPKALPTGPLATVIAALVQMGYRRGEAERAVEGLDETRPVEELLRDALGALR